MSMRVGMIGLGKMGAGIAKSLLRAGHCVTVYNRTRERAEALQADGATVAGSIAEACRSGVVLTMVADDAALEAVALGEGGVLASLPKGGVHTSLSTISVTLSDRLAAEHTKAGQEFVSAPVIGRPDAAESGRVVVVAAGPEKILERCKPLFAAMGPRLVVVGTQPSMANVTKLAGNFLIATMLESLGEAMALVRKSGVDDALVMDLWTSTFLNTPLFKLYGDLIVQGRHEPAAFELPLGLKDVRLTLAAAESKSVPMPIASVLRDRFVTAMARGHQKKDWSVIARMAAEDAGLPAKS